ncbi:NAD(P)/FAD-dependent oxidoreductase [Chryseobacterium sp.]|uniref:FAD-dependent oxidoreductase n=1 Tax=Chryseobacterium sp. TaxID=1871047 RepID=UPI00289AADE3|nr:NAD(P)/FAD-dependent oxidoreductase [Chryseobacterium sp.]
MKLEHKKIVIIGGGPGGLTLARLLQMNGAEVKVYEHDLDKNARVQGSPLDLHENSGLAAISKAGLLDEFKNNFMPKADRMKIMNPAAEVLYSDHDEKIPENFGDPHFRPEIDRGVLRKILLESLQPETVVWNSHFTSMEKWDNSWKLHFKNRESVYADFVIAADGANSKIRKYITDIKPFYSGITMIEVTIYDAENKAPKVFELLSGGKIMAFGNEKNILMGQKADGSIGFYTSLKLHENWLSENEIDWNDRQSVFNWFKKKYSEWNSVWDELFENAELPFIPRPIYCMPLDQNWKSLPNLTMIGDAAHVMPPFAGEGVNMAMRDALDLSELLLSENNSVEEAIEKFEIEMRKRASEAAKESLENGETMLSINSLTDMLKFFTAPHE